MSASEFTGSKAFRRGGDAPARSFAPAVGADARSTSIDLLRGTAILLVVARHWPGSPTEPAALRQLWALGWMGVDLFFVLSGFLISTLLFREIDRSGRIDLPRFWLRRGLRIWPAYFAVFGGVILLRSAVDGVAGRGWSLPLEQWPNLLLIQNYFPPEVRWHHSWSLAIEEHFYLALPLLLLALGRVRTAMFGMAALLGCLALRSALVADGAGWAAVYYPTHLRFDSLMVGVLVGYACRYHAEAVARVVARWPLVLAACVLAVASVAFRPVETSAYTPTLGFSLLAWTFGGVVMVAAAHPGFGERWAPCRLLAWVGVHSYSIYLVHGAMTELPGYSALMGATGALGIPGKRALFLLTAIAGGVAVARFVERPAMRWRERLTRPPSAALQVQRAA